MDKGVWGRSSLLSGMGGWPSLPKVFCSGWHMEGDGGRSGQVCSPAQRNQVTSQGDWGRSSRGARMEHGTEHVGHCSSLLYTGCCGFRVLCPASE